MSEKLTEKFQISCRCFFTEKKMAKECFENIHLLNTEKL